MEEKEIYAALGIEPKTADDGGAADGQPKEQENAEPADTEETAAIGENEQEPAEPEEAEAEAEEEEQSEEPAEQTKEQRAKNAAKRRRAEQEAAVQAAVEEALRKEREKNDSEWKRFYENSGLMFTDEDGTRRPVTNAEEYSRYIRERDRADIERDLKSGKLTAETLERAVKNVMPAQMVQETPVPPQPDIADFRMRTQSEIDEISKYDPSVKRIEDLPALGRYPEMLEKLRRGYNFIDAYISVYRDEIEAKRAEAARQQAMNAERSKSHLTGTSQRGAGALPVPSEVKTLYRTLIPGISDAEISKKYNKQMNGRK